MSTTSVVEQHAERIEQELTRVRAARPALASRVERAENILVTHLSCRRARVIRVRVAGGGHPRFLVSGSGGAVYIVDPASWECSCPDAHRRGKGCKHALACWALWRADARPASTPCASCGERLPRRELVEVGPVEAEHSLDASEGERLCRPCAARVGVL